MDSFTEQFFTTLSQYKVEGIKVSWPSTCFTELKMSISGIQAGKSMNFILPCNPKYQDSLGFISPGYLYMALTEAFYCFAYSLAKKPCIPIHTEFSLINPVPANSSALTVETYIGAKSRKMLFLNAKVFDYREKVHAIASAMVTPYTLPTSSELEKM
ncbi:MAG: hypothetical protein N3G21_12125 [Candidatus Hydrogenedentes bacterium]|nr:hypothetical protein [Candidatus Hydrogenedentota bacterium]